MSAEAPKSKKNFLSLFPMKKFASRLVSAAWLLGVACASLAQESGTGWTLTADGELTVTSQYEKIPLNATKAKVKTVKIADDVTQIPQYAFYQFRNLVSVSIGPNVQTIGYSAFQECAKLAAVEFPSAVKKIDVSAFQSCSALTRVVIPEGLSEIGTRAFAFSGLQSVEVLSYAKIESSAFEKCRQLRTVVLSSYCTFGNYCFSECTALERVTLPGYGDVAEQAFKGCTSLAEVDIPEGVGTIYSQAFYGCTSLASVSLPKSLNGIWSEAFGGCSGLVEVASLGSKPTRQGSGTSPFDGIAATAVLRVEQARIPEYADWAAWFGGRVKPLPRYEVETGGGDAHETVKAASAEAVQDLWEQMGRGRHLVADIVISSPVAFTPPTFDVETSNAETIVAALPRWPSVPNFSGTMRGNLLSSVGISSAGLFSTVEQGATVANLSLEKATLHFAPDDTSSFVPAGSDTTFLCIVARRNHGTLRNVSFQGAVIVDESKQTSGKTLALCLAGESDGDTLTGFIYVDDAVTTASGGNKRMIPIKQNLATGRNKTRSNTKVAVRNSSMTATTPTDGDGDAQRLRGAVVEFSDTEFADGTVADWLNHSGTGLDGENTRYWKQGEKVPTPAANAAEALYKIEYEVEGETDKAKLTGRPTFANGGQEITLSYTATPAEIKMGETTVTPAADSVKFAYEGGKKLTVRWRSVGLPDAPSVAVRVSVAGCRVAVDGADGEVKRLYDVRGALVAQTRERELTAPAGGVYVVRAGAVAKVVRTW